MRLDANELIAKTSFFLFNLNFNRNKKDCLIHTYEAIN